jgi:hypothetical protein
MSQVDPYAAAQAWRKQQQQQDPGNGEGQGIGPSPDVVEQQQQPQQTREQWRDAWMGAGQMSPDDADKWLSSHGAQQLGEKAGVWRTPSGDVLDLQIGRGGAKATGGKITPGWTQVGGGQQDQNQQQMPDQSQWGQFGQPGGMMGGPMGPSMSRVDQFAQMFGNPQDKLRKQGMAPS